MSRDKYALARAFAGLSPVEGLSLTPLAHFLVQKLDGKQPDAQDVGAGAGMVRAGSYHPDI